jgi:hypothetical protein
MSDQARGMMDAVTSKAGGRDTVTSGIPRKWVSSADLASPGPHLGSSGSYAQGWAPVCLPPSHLLGLSSTGCLASSNRKIQAGRGL